MKLIPLGGKYANGAVALVDDADFDEISKQHWFFVPPDPKTGRYSAYAYTRTKKGRMGMHTAVMKPDAGMETDHQNHDGLNNQRYNLRNVTARQNCFNRRKKRGSTSPYKGVHKRKDTGEYQATITYQGRLRWIGYFDSERHAALAYDMWATLLHGEFALLNFEPVGGLYGQIRTPKEHPPVDGTVGAGIRHDTLQEAA
jgi:hypothetical protein